MGRILKWQELTRKQKIQAYRSIRTEDELSEAGVSNKVGDSSISLEDANKWLKRAIETL